MLHIILDTVVDIWNKTYIKLPTFQLEILGITKNNVDAWPIILIHTHG